MCGTPFVIQREYVPKFIFAISHCVGHEVARHKQLSSRSSSYHEPSLLMILRSAAIPVQRRVLISDLEESSLLQLTCSRKKGVLGRV